MSFFGLFDSDDAKLRMHKKKYTLHAVEVMTALEQMRKETTACDFIIKVGKLEFPVHRAILVACSKYFRAMFGSFMKESIEGVAVLKDLDENSVHACVNFMYTGQCSDLNSEKAIEVLHAATVLQLDKLRSLCFNFLAGSISPANCLTIMNLSELYNENDLKQAATKCFSEKFKLVTSAAEFLQVTKDEALMYIMQYGSSDELIWSASKSWIEWDIDNRADEVTEFFNMMSLEVFPSQYVINSLWKANYFQESDLCKDQLCKYIFSDVARLAEHLSMENWFVLNSMAEYYEHVVQDIQDEICYFMLNNFTLIANDDDFCKLPKNDVIAMFKSPEAVYFSSEKLKWNAMLRWMKRNENADSSVFCKFLEVIDFRRLSRRFIMDAISNEVLVQKHPSGRKILEAAFRQSTIHAEDNAIAILGKNNAIDLLRPKNHKWTPLHHAAQYDVQIASMNGHLCLIDGKDLYLWRKGKCVRQTSLSKIPPKPSIALGLHDRLCLFINNTFYSVFDALTNTWDEFLPLPSRFGSAPVFYLNGKSKIYLISSTPATWIVENTRVPFEGKCIPPEMDCCICEETSGAFCAGHVYVSGKSQRLPDSQKFTIAKYSVDSGSWTHVAVPILSNAFKLFSFKNSLYACHAVKSSGDWFYAYNEEWNEWSQIMKNIPRKSMYPGNDVQSVCSFTTHSEE